ncbi:MAG: glycosyl hydrolase family 28-related protein [Sandaracinaceae bacterium]
MHVRCFDSRPRLRGVILYGLLLGLAGCSSDEAPTDGGDARDADTMDAAAADGSVVPDGTPPEERCLSALWGADGASWDQDGRLRDFTDVGYRSGDVAIPDWPVGVDVSDFGAVADDGNDDTEAFRQAIAACPDEHAVLVPEGRFILREQLRITRDAVVLRGQDMYESVLFFPENMVETAPPAERAEFIRFEGTAEQGIENLSLVFRDQMKMGHWEFRGADAISFGRDVEDSWARNLYIRNADHGIQVSGTHISVLNVILDHFAGREDIIGTSGITGWVGHVGIGMTSHHSLFHNIEFRGRYFHEFDIINVPTSNVVSNIRGLDMSLHHHGQGARDNLYTNVYAGAGSRALGGLSDSQRQMNETHWGIYGDAPLAPGMIPEDSQNGHVFVGFGSDDPTSMTDTQWIERCSPGTLFPPNLYLAQMERAGKPLPEGPPPPPPGVDPTEASVLRIAPSNDGLRFELSRVEWSELHRARLRVNVSRAVRTPFAIELFGVLSGEGDGAVRSDVLDSIDMQEETQNRWVEFDVTAFVSGRLNDGEPDVSFAFEFGTPGTFNGSLRTGADGGNAPALIVERTDSAVPGPPSAPTGLAATSAAGHILLDWDDSPESDVLYYNVYRNEGGSAGTNYTDPIAMGLLYSAFADVTYEENRSNADLPSDRDFHYVVTAVDEHLNESPLSAEAIGTALPTP